MDEEDNTALKLLVALAARALKAAGFPLDEKQQGQVADVVVGLLALLPLIISLAAHFAKKEKVAS